MIPASIIGLSAAAITTMSMMPQAYKSWRTRSTKDLSLPMLSMLFVGLILWLAYGLMIGDAPLIFANSISLLVNIATLFLKLKYK